MSKFTPNEEKELIMRYRSGWSIRKLQLEYETYCNAIYRVLRKHNVESRKTPGKNLGDGKPHPPARCGTAGGYKRHIRLGQTPCLPCYDANAESAKRSRQRIKNQQVLNVKVVVVSDRMQVTDTIGDPILIRFLCRHHKVDPRKVMRHIRRQVENDPAIEKIVLNMDVLRDTRFANA